MCIASLSQLSPADQIHDRSADLRHDPGPAGLASRRERDESVRGMTGRCTLSCLIFPDWLARAGPSVVIELTRCECALISHVRVTRARSLPKANYQNDNQNDDRYRHADRNQEQFLQNKTIT